MRVFLSYRRRDSQGWAGRLADDLDELLGAGSVFRDVSTIEAGEAFSDVIQAGVREADAVLVLIGHDWLALLRPGDDGVDWVSRELNLAREAGARVLPVLVDGAPVPPATALPEGLRWLLGVNAARLADTTWHRDVADLAARLRGEVVARARPDARALVSAGMVAGVVLLDAVVGLAPAIPLAVAVAAIGVAGLVAWRPTGPVVGGKAAIAVAALSALVVGMLAATA